MNIILVVCAAVAPVLVLGGPARLSSEGGDGGFGCLDGCEHKGLCFGHGQYWTDSSEGCVQFQCVSTTNERDNSTKHLIGTLGCAYVLPPTNDVPFVKVEGNSSAPYPDCCSRLVLLKEPSETTTAAPILH